MNYFDVVLKMEFLLTHHIILVSATSCLMIMGGDLCVVLVQNKQPEETKLISTLQFKRGVKREEPFLFAILMGDKEGEEEEIPPAIEDMLKSLEDVMLDQLP